RRPGCADSGGFNLFAGSGPDSGGFAPSGSVVSAPGNNREGGFGAAKSGGALPLLTRDLCCGPGWSMVVGDDQPVGGANSLLSEPLFLTGRCPFWPPILPDGREV